MGGILKGFVQDFMIFSRASLAWLEICQVLVKWTNDRST